MCTVWHVDKYEMTFKLVINSRRISRGPAVDKHCCTLFVLMLYCHRKKVKVQVCVNEAVSTLAQCFSTSRPRPGTGPRPGG